MTLLVPMIPSFVTGRPTGKETGKYLALDLGGTNLRVCEFELKGDGSFHVHQQKYVVAEELKTGDMRRLCDFIADCVDNFTSEYGSGHIGNHLQLGFTFSFAVNQTDINRGTLMHWTKGFNCSGAINKDVVVLLQDSFLRKNIHVHIAAVSCYSSLSPKVLYTFVVRGSIRETVKKKTFGGLFHALYIASFFLMTDSPF